MRKRNQNHQGSKRMAGQMFIELIVAVGIITVALVAVVAMSTQSVKIQRASGSRGEATSLANRNLEEIRNLKNNDVVGFFNAVPTIVPAPPNCPITASSVYSCSVNYSLTGSDEMKVTVTVSWAEGSNTMSVDVSSILTKGKMGIFASSPSVTPTASPTPSCPLYGETNPHWGNYDGWRCEEIYTCGLSDPRCPEWEG